MAWFESKRYKKLQAEIKALQSANYQNISARIINGINQRFDSTNYYPDWDTATITGKYATSDQVYSVINKIADKTSLIPIYVYLKKDKKAFQKLQVLTNRDFYTNKGLLDVIITQKKALEDASENDYLYKLLENPNKFQSKSEFVFSACGFYELNGECFIYKEMVEDGANAGKPYQLHILPPSNVTMYVTREFPQEITGYDFVVDGKKILSKIPPEYIIHWKKQKLCTFSLDGSHLRGLSPLRPGATITDRLSEADKRSINQLKNGAVPGIVYDDTFNGDESEQSIFDKQKKAFYDFSMNAENQGAPFFVGTKKGFIQTGLSAADLKLIELQGIDFKRLCNIYNLSTILFNSDTAATESNVQQMIKQAYTSVYIPLIFSFVQKLSASLLPDFEEKYVITADISQITELQDDLKNTIEMVAALPIGLTGNELRALLNYDEMDLPYMNQPTIKSGYQFFDDINVPPVDPNLL